METKTCTKCNQEKLINEFSIRSSIKGTYQSHCKSCIAQQDKDRYSTQERKNSIRKANKIFIEKTKEFVNNYKEEKGCFKCGDKRHYVLDFHHVDDSDKEFNIANKVNRGISIQTIMLEINKCEVVCANCHRELHYLERIGD